MGEPCSKNTSKNASTTTDGGPPQNGSPKAGRLAARHRVIAVTQLLVIAVVVGLFASGLSYVPEVIGVYSPPICGPIKDQFNNVVRDAGPCPSPHSMPPPIEAHWEWTPFWRTD
jgi:hypothetical protein